MTVSTQTNKVSYTGTGANTALAINFPFINSSELTVTRRVTSTGVETTMILTTDYTVTGGDFSTGTLTVVDGATDFPSIVTWTIERNTPLTQLTDYVANDNFGAGTHENALDKAMYVNQDQEDKIDRSLRVPISDADPGELPNSVDRAGQLLAFDAQGDPVATTITSLSASTVATAYIETLLDDVDADTARATLNARFGGKGLYDVTNPTYGAKGDGVTDDTVAIQAALDAVTEATGEGGKVVIPHGQYIIKTGPLVVRDDTVIEGWGLPELFASGAAMVSKSIMAITGSSESDIRVKNILFSGLGSNEGAADDESGFDLGSALGFNIHFESCTFSKCKSGIRGGSGNGRVHASHCDFRQFSHAGVHLAAVENLWVDNCWFDGDRAGIGDAVDGLVGVWITQGADGTGSDGRAVSITNNKIENTTNEGIICKASESVVTGNTVHAASGFGIIVEASAGSTDDGGGTQINVSDNSVKNCNGGIRASLDPANTSLEPKDVIIANNNIIDINGVGNHGITISQNVAGKSVIRTKISGNHIHDVVANGIGCTKLADCMIDGNLISSVSNGITLSGTADISENAVIGNMINDCQAGGIVTQSGALREVIAGNVIRNVSLATADTSDGITINTSGTDCVVVNNIIDGGTTGNMRDGVRNNGTTCSVEGNIILRATRTPQKEIVIATGAVTIRLPFHTIDTQSNAASDDLDTINGGAFIGQRVVVQANNNSRTVVLKDGTGNLNLGADFSMDNADDVCEFIWNGTAWNMISSSSNGA